MEDDPICVLCESGVRAKQQRLDCSKCQDTFHRTCTQMKQDYYRTLKKAMELEQWVCGFCKEGNNTVDLDTTNEEDTELENNSGDNENTVTACSQNEANNSANNPVTEISDTPNNTRDTYTGGNNTVNLDSSDEEDTNTDKSSHETDRVETESSLSSTDKTPITVNTETSARGNNTVNLDSSDEEDTNTDKSSHETDRVETESSLSPIVKAPISENTETSATDTSPVPTIEIRTKIRSSLDSVYVSWTPQHVDSSSFFYNYSVSATEVETGYCVFSSETVRFGFLSFTRSELITGLERGKTYTFTVTYWKDTEKILSSTSEQIKLENTSSGSSLSASTHLPSQVQSSLISSSASSIVSTTSSGNTSISSSTGTVVSSVPPNIRNSVTSPNTSSILSTVSSNTGNSAFISSSSALVSTIPSIARNSVVSISTAGSSFVSSSATESSSSSINSSRQNPGVCRQGLTSSRQNTTRVISLSHQPAVSSCESVGLSIHQSATKQSDTQCVGQGTADSRRGTISSDPVVTSKELKYGCCRVHGYIRQPPTNNPQVVQLEPSPFSKVQRDLIALRPLVGTDSASYYKFQSLNFGLRKEDQELFLSVPREDIGTDRCRYQIQLRFNKQFSGLRHCLTVLIPAKQMLKLTDKFCLDNKSCIQKDCFPVGCVRVNGKWAQLQPVAVGTQCNVKSDGHPIDITSLCDRIRTNTIGISWNQRPNTTGYCLTVQLVEKLTSEQLLNVLKVKQFHHSHHTQDRIREQLKLDSDNEISTTSMRASLMCPIGRIRMTYPCIGKNCTHVQCVDALTMLQMNEKKPNWKCLICSSPVPFSDLRINEYFMKVLDSVNEDQNEVELTADGSWKVPEEKQHNKDEEVNDLSESLNMIDLTESDDENIPPSPCREKTFSISTVSNTKLKSSVVPLGENRRILNKATNAVEIVDNVANAVNTVANAVVHRLTGSTISTQVSTQRVSSQNTAGFGHNYNQSSVNSHRRNNQSRNHNNRPYDRNRGHNQYRRNRYGSTDSPSRRNNNGWSTDSPSRRNNHGYGSYHHSNNNRNNNYHSHWSYRSNYYSGSNYNSQSQSQYYGNYRSWRDNIYA